jgi:hypothetical protein
MKNLIILSVLLFGFTFIASGQKDAPEAVKKVFAQKYADAKSIKWVNESANEWEAEFTLNGKEMSAAYDNTGKWLETETEMAAKDLPAAVTATLNKEFAGYKPGESSVVENPDMKGFEIALKKGETALEVVIDANGKVLKNTTVTKKVEKEEKK